MYQCPNCAGNLKFDIVRQKLYCEHCDTTVDPYVFYKERDAEETAASAAEPGAAASDGMNVEEYEVTVFTCPECGGQILSEDTTAATFCSFCGGTVVLDRRISRERRPHYIIPFQKTKEDCRNAYVKMMRRAVFAPRALKDESQIERFRGIYMPYWIYTFGRQGAVSLKGSKTHRRGDYLITKHYALDCKVDAEYSGIAYDASASFSDSLSGAIAPFNLRQGKPFAPSFLSGFYADTHDVDKYVYETDAEDIAAEDACRRFSKDPVCRKYHVKKGYAMSNAVRPFKSEAELAMLPVWFLSYRNGDRVGYAVVNGQTGKAAADLPVDGKKYLAGSLLLAVPLFLLLNMFFTITPGKILMIALLLAFLCMLISNMQMSDIIAREEGENDKGLSFLHPVPDIGNAVEEEKEKRRRRDKHTENKNLRILGLVVGAICAGNFLPAILLPVLRWMLMRETGAGVIVMVLFLIIGILCAAVWKLIAGLTGYTPKKKSRYTGHIKEKWPTLIKPFGGMMLAVLILIINPVSDWFYYIGAFLCMGTVLWAIMDIIKQHNMLTTRKLPQFNKRGGDEVA